jgi:hypothetical protein
LSWRLLLVGVLPCAIAHAIAAPRDRLGVPAGANRGQVMADGDCPKATLGAADDPPGGSGVRPHDASPRRLCIAVQSSGSTDRSSFEVAVDTGGPTTRIALKRTRPDWGRMRPHQVWLRYSWDELGLDGPRPLIVEETN